MASSLGVLASLVGVGWTLADAPPAVAGDIGTQAGCVASGGTWDPPTAQIPIPGCIFGPKITPQPSTITATTTCGKLWQMYQQDLQIANQETIAEQRSLDVQAATIAHNGYLAEGCTGGIGGGGAINPRAAAAQQLRGLAAQGMANLSAMAQDHAARSMANFQNSLANAPAIDAASDQLGSAQADTANIQADADKAAQAEIAQLANDADTSPPPPAPQIQQPSPDQDSPAPASTLASNGPSDTQPADAAPVDTTPADTTSQPEAPANAGAEAPDETPDDSAAGLSPLNLAKVAQSAADAFDAAADKINAALGLGGDPEEQAQDWAKSKADKQTMDAAVKATCGDEEADEASFCGSNVRRTYEEAKDQVTADEAKSVSEKTLSISKYLHDMFNNNMPRIQGGIDAIFAPPPE